MVDFSYGEMLDRLKQRRLRVDMIEIYQIIGDINFKGIWGDLLHSVVDLWNLLPEEVVTPDAITTFKRHLDGHLNK